MKRRFAPTMVTGVLALGLAACGQAESGSGGEVDYPRRNISIIAPAPAGGPLDVAARAVQPCLEDELGRKVLVENKPGGSGAIGVTEMVNSTPDGHTLGTIAGSTIIQPLLDEEVTYTKDDYRPLAVLTQIPSVFIVRADSPFATAQDLLDAARAAPDTVTLATPGAGTSLQIGALALADQHDVAFRAVPFNGHPELMRALLGDNVDAAFDVATPDILEQVEAGDLRLLAAGTDEPQDFLPEAVPFAELGLAGIPATGTFFGLAGPLDLPADVVEKLAATVETCLAEDQVRETLGASYVPDAFMGPDATRELVDELTGQYQPYVAAS